MREEVLRLHDVTFMSQGSVQLEDFSLYIYAGEIVGMLQLHGHGVTALLNLLEHNPPLQSGYVYYREALVNSWQTRGIGSNRIAVIKNTSALIPNMTVADNVFVLRPGFQMWVIRPKLLSKQVQPALDELGVSISADAYVDSLTSFEKLVVELVKAVVAGCRLIVLREIGTIVSDRELARLHEIMRYYAGKGIAFLDIGFHYEELSRVCDRTAIYSNGRILKYLSPSDPALPEQALYARRKYDRLKDARRPEKPGRMLEVRGLCGGEVRDLSFCVSGGECVVVQDPQNRVFDELLAMLLGDRVIEAGEVEVDGRPLAQVHPREIAVIREQPETSMVFEELSCLDNLCMTVDHRLPEIWSDRRLRAGVRRELAPRLGEEIFDRPVSTLGRKERCDIVFQRILLQRPKAVFCVQPFQGADMGMRAHIWEQLKSLMDEGVAVVILVVNLADCLTLASRLVRVEQGKPRVIEREDFNQTLFF